jgi:hypothetical protein
VEVFLVSVIVVIVLAEEVMQSGERIELSLIVQVVPYSAGGHTGLLGACTIAELDGSPGIVNLEDIADGRVTDDVATVSQVTDKRRQIPRYAMAAWLWFKCYIDVLVICPDETTATWYAEPLPTALDDCLYRPKALLPSRVPAITDPGQVAADPDMAVLSVAYHGQDPAVAGAFVEGIGILGPERGEDYYEYANILSPQQVRDLLEAVMTAYHPPRVSAFAKRHYGEGLAEGESKGESKGEIKGERHTIRMVLKARGLSLTEDQSSLIETCDDLTTLRKWSDTAVTAKDASDIFD